jgi:hypothetical protein
MGTATSRTYWLCALLASTACRASESVDDQCPAFCSNCDPRIQCSPQTYCPLGSSCRDREPPDAGGAGSPGVDGGGPHAVCAPEYFPAVNPEALLDGFGVSEFLLARDTTMPGRYSFVAPKGSRFVTCGLLVAAPRFEQQRLVNLGASVARTRVFQVDETTGNRMLVLRLDELRSTTNSCKGKLNGPPVSGSEHYPLVETLSLGCWALGDQSVVGASSLLPIAPGELPDSGTNPLESCDLAAGETEGAPCLMKRVPGSCVNGSCKGGETPNDGGVFMDAPTNCRGLAPGTLCHADPESPIGRCRSGGCVNQNVSSLERPLVVADCASTGNADWLNCFPSPLGSIGTCWGKLCRPRCHDTQDCRESEEFRAKPASKEQCERPDASYLGVCIDEGAKL